MKISFELNSPNPKKLAKSAAHKLGEAAHAVTHAKSPSIAEVAGAVSGAVNKLRHKAADLIDPDDKPKVTSSK